MFRWIKNKINENKTIKREQAALAEKTKRTAFERYGITPIVSFKRIPDRKRKISIDLPIGKMVMVQVEVTRARAEICRSKIDNNIVGVEITYNTKVFKKIYKIDGATECLMNHEITHIKCDEHNEEFKIEYAKYSKDIDEFLSDEKIIEKYGVV